jgi:hypothetical protein
MLEILVCVAMLAGLCGCIDPLPHHSRFAYGVNRVLAQLRLTLLSSLLGVVTGGVRMAIARLQCAPTCGDLAGVVEALVLGFLTAGVALVVLTWLAWRGRQQPQAIIHRHVRVQWLSLAAGCVLLAVIVS